MKKIETIYSSGDHQWSVVARDPERASYLIDTNEYLIAKGGQMLLTDPGGMEVFPAVFSAISREFDPTAIQALFASHQDPDIISSLGLWLEFKPELKCYLSRLWTGFIPHFGGDDKTFIPVPDEGMKISFNGLELEMVPAHYLHSSGNIHLYDRKARILFSGDVGAALLPADAGLYVTDFDRHIVNAEGFHKRWMGSNYHKDQWCERVAGMEIDMLCPQHGAIYRGEDVKRFIDWFHRLDVGLN